MGGLRIARYSSRTLQHCMRITDAHARQCSHRMQHCAVATSGRAAAQQREVVVIGGGAAGLTAAYFAATHGAKVTVLERASECGKKILMSGGTRCNVLPATVDLQSDFFTDSPAGAMRAMFASWDVWGCWAWLADPGQVGLHLELEEDSSKWFPASNSAKDVRDKLVAACKCGALAPCALRSICGKACNVTIRCGCKSEGVHMLCAS